MLKNYTLPKILILMILSFTMGMGVNQMRNRGLEGGDRTPISYHPPGKGWLCAQYGGGEHADGMRLYTAEPGQPWVLRDHTEWPYSCFDHSALVPEGNILAFDVRAYRLTPLGTVIESEPDHGEGWNVDE